MIIAINRECIELFEDFADAHSDSFQIVQHKSIAGSKEIVEILVTITPHILTALTAYLVARIQSSKKEIKIKKGDLEIELKNIDITPETAMSLLTQLEQKPRSE